MINKYETTFKVSLKEGSASPRTLACALLNELIEKKEDYVYLSFVLTKKTEGQFAEKVLSILRCANNYLEDPNSFFVKKLNSTNYILECELPIAKNEYGENINVVKGYGDGLRVNKIKVRLVNKNKLENKKENLGKVIISSKTESKSAGKVASRTIRTLVKDDKSCLLEFILNKRNSLEMSSKVLSALRIANRMIKDPVSVISEDLPNTQVKYDIKFYGPFIFKVKSNTDENFDIYINGILLTIE